MGVYTSHIRSELSAQDWAPAISMAAVYGIFFAEIAAYRIGTKRLARLGVNYSLSHYTSSW